VNINEIEKICPLCGQDNNCQHNHTTCWCVKVKIPKQVLDMIPDDKKGKACICESCIEKFQGDKTD
jgi:hypothetical protein